MLGRGESLLKDVKRLGSGDLLREDVPVHYSPGYKGAFVTVHRRLVLLELLWFSPWLLAWMVWGRNIHYGFGDPVHHPDAAVGPSLFVSVDVPFQSQRWCPVFCGLCSWQIVLPSSGPSRAGSHASDGRGPILMSSIPALVGPWPCRLAPSVWVGTGACFSTGNKAGDLQSWWFHRCGCSRWAWSWLLPLGTAWSWLTWPLLLPSYSGTSLGVSPCSSLWE